MTGVRADGGTAYRDYLGDGVYVDYDGYHIVLTTEDGVRQTNKIALDGQVMSALDRYRERLKGMLRTEP